MGARHIAVIVAAGKGLRMQSGRKKQYLELDKIPVLVHTLKVFDSHPGTDELVVVVPASELAFCRDMIASHRLEKPIHLTPGGAERQDSVEKGIHKAKDLCAHPASTFIMVHDGVRPFVSHGLVDACMAAAKKTGAAIPALPVTDTIKVVTDQGMVEKTPDRRRLFRAQTPQVFRLDLGIAAFAHAGKTQFKGTDEASILEHAGTAVRVVEGAEANIKLTTPQDLDMARYLLSLKPG